MESRRIVGALGLARSLRDQACQLFQTAQNADLSRGRSLESMAAACVYIASLQRGEDVSVSIERLVLVADNEAPDQIATDGHRSFERVLTEVEG